MSKLGFRFTKKGVIALSLLILLLAGAIWLNIRMNADDDNPDILDADGTNSPGGLEPVDAEVFNGYFQQFRNERNSVRAQEIEYLRMIIAEDSADTETLQNAQQRLMELVSHMEQEFAIESQIRAKGFLDAAVTFRSDSISVIVDGDSLTDEEVARILDIVRTETGAAVKDIKVWLSRG